MAKNPVDHPHGGRTNGGRPSCTPWGVYCKGKRTRLRNKWTNRFIVMRKGGQPIDKFVNARKAKTRAGAGQGGAGGAGGGSQKQGSGQKQGAGQKQGGGQKQAQAQG